MKIKLQILEYESDKELSCKYKQLAKYVSLLRLQFHPVTDRHYKDVFYIPLNNYSTGEACLLMNAIEAYCLQNDVGYKYVE